MEQPKPAQRPLSCRRGPAARPLANRAAAPPLALALATVALAFAPGCSSGPPVTPGGGGETAPRSGPSSPRTVDFTDLPVAEVTGGLVRFQPGSHVLDGTGSPAMVIEGRSGLVLDLTDVELRGGLVGGYSCCLLVEDSSDVRLRGMAFDGWFAPTLRSTAYAEDPSDALDVGAAADPDRWLDGGAAIAARASSNLDIGGCRGRRGQHGVLLVDVQRSTVSDCDFSFLSGWGLMLGASSDNVVSHNVFDYCVRGYSQDVYWSGQGSAGVLLVDGSSRNRIAVNSATHCGSGVRLYGGDAVARDGAPGATGCDDNVIRGNDLRHAVRSGVEVAFGEGNAVLGCDVSGSAQDGIVGRHAGRLALLDNRAVGVRGRGIALSHARDCVASENRLMGNEVGFACSWDDDPLHVDGPYGRTHSTDSRGHWVIRNTFENNVLDLVIRASREIVFHGNRYVPGTRDPYIEDIAAASDPTLDPGTVQRWLDALDGAFPSGNVSDVTFLPWSGQVPELLREWMAYRPEPDMPGSAEVRAEARDEFGGGLESIVMGERGPWDFRSAAPRPLARRPGGLLSNVTWDATWFRWQNGVSDPRTAEEAWRRCATAAPLERRRVQNFVNPWGTDDVRRQVGTEFFGLFAQTVVDLSDGGLFDLTVVSDDGVRVFVDGELVHERWTIHGPTRDERQILLDAGEHVLRLEYFQVQGTAALVVELRPHD